MRPIDISSLLGGLTRRGATVFILAAGAAGLAPSARAANAGQIAQDAHSALDRLYAAQPKTREFGQKAKAVLVFPSIVKAGLVVGGQGGEGAMLVNGEPVGFYRIGAVSYGLQAGAETYAYALFFMTDSAVDYLKNSKGWSVGSGPSIVMLDKGKARNTNTTTLKKDVYAVAFGQHGLMAGLGLEGSKISEIHPDA